MSWCCQEDLPSQHHDPDNPQQRPAKRTCHDALGVAGAVAVDVVDRLLHAPHQLQRHLVGAVLVPVRGRWG